MEDVFTAMDFQHSSLGQGKHCRNNAKPAALMTSAEQSDGPNTNQAAAASLVAKELEIEAHQKVLMLLGKGARPPI